MFKAQTCCKIIKNRCTEAKIVLTGITERTEEAYTVGAAEAFWRNFDLRDGGPKAAGRLL